MSYHDLCEISAYPTDMNDQVVIIGSSCRLPGGVNKTSQIWNSFLEGDNKLSSSPPASRAFDINASHNADEIGKAGWISDDGVVSFDPSFFRISPAEAVILRPSTRLALELTWEALESAGIPPSSLRGGNVSVSIGVGTEDGWDLKRYSDEGDNAFDSHWAASSDPSGVSGHVSHFFGFRGPASVISSACSSAAFSLRDGEIVCITYVCTESHILSKVFNHSYTTVVILL